MSEPQREDLQAQIDQLAQFILHNIPGEPSRDESAIECAIRLLKLSGPYVLRSSGIELTPENHDPVMAQAYLLVPKDMKCHKCGAEEPWKDPLRKEVAETLGFLEGCSLRELKEETCKIESGNAPAFQSHTGVPAGNVTVAGNRLGSVHAADGSPQPEKADGKAGHEGQ